MGESADSERFDQSVALLSFALDSVKEAAFLIDEQARFHYVNDEACRALGYTRAELLGLAVPDVDPDFPAERWPAHWKELQARRSLTFEGRHRTREGRIFPVEVGASYSEFGGRAFNLALVRDITERKRTEDALRESEERYRKLLGSVTDYIYTVQVQDGRALSTVHGPGCAAVTGYSQEEYAADPGLWLRMVHEPDRAAVLGQADRLLAGEAVSPIEHRLRHRDGSLRWVRNTPVPRHDAQHRLVAYDGLIADITAQKQAEAAQLLFLERMDGVHRAIQGAADLERMMSDVLDCVLAAFDCERAYLLFPCDPDAAFWSVPMERSRPGWPGARTLGQELPVDPDVAGTFRLLLDADRPVQFGPGTGHPLPADVAERFGFRSFMAMAIRPKVGGPWQFGIHSCSRPRLFTPEEEQLLQEVGRRVADGLTTVLVHRDLRAREEEVRELNRELERRVADRTAQLEAANRELEAFAYSVSHDLRAPLRHVNGFLGLLGQHAGPALDERGRHFMESAAAAAERMSTLIDDLLAFSRMGRQAMSKARVDLSALAQEVVDELGPETRDRTVRWKVGPLPVVSGDRAMLRLVLLNLLSNALKFTRPRPVAEIELDAATGAAGEPVIAVRDNGVGFDMAYGSHLFEVFHRLHRSEEFEGVGIGLANVRRVIARHGGRAWAEGKVDGGATFFFSLPG